MRRRRSGFLVKLFNLVYIGACAISVYALCTRPIIKANVHVNFTKEKMGSLLSGLFNRGSESSEESEEERSEIRLVYREDGERNIKDYITKEKIESYFPNGYQVDIPVEIKASQAFDLKNTKLLDDLIQFNLGTIVDNVYNSIINPLSSLFRDIVEGYAKDTLKAEINKQIESLFPGGAPATDEEVQQIFDNVYALMESDEPVTVDQLAETILGNGDSSGVLDIINSRGSKYVPYTAPVREDYETDEDYNAAVAQYELDLEAGVEADRTVEEKENQQYFIRHENVEYQHNTNPYSSETAYFDKDGNLLDPQPGEEAVNADIEATEGEQQYFVGVIKYTYTHNTEAYDSSVTYYKPVPYTNDDIDNEKIAEQMAQAMEGVDGLVTKTPVICNPQPTQAQVEEDLAKPENERIYYVLDGNGDPVLPTEYDATATYYTVDKIVNDVETAMAALIDSFLNGGANGGKAIVRGEEVESSKQEPKSISENIKDYLYNLIPSNVSSRAGAVGEKAPYILLLLIFIFALPWLWFAFVTVLRTIRRDKFWTRPMIVLFWAAPQVIFGLLLTYGSKRIIPYLMEHIQAFQEYAQSFNFDIRTGCLIPSFVYLGVLAMTIVYWIIRRPLKIQYKMEKYARKRRPRRPRQPKQPRQPKGPRQPLGPRHPKYPFDDWEYNEKDKIWW